LCVQQGATTTPQRHQPDVEAFCPYVGGEEVRWTGGEGG
jgi:hypothetical protein